MDLASYTATTDIVTEIATTVLVELASYVAIRTDGKVVAIMVLMRHTLALQCKK